MHACAHVLLDGYYYAEVTACLLAGHVNTGELENGLAQPLLLSGKEQADEDEDIEDEDSEEAHEDSHTAASSIGAAYRLLTPSVKVTIPY